MVKGVREGKRNRSDEAGCIKLSSARTRRTPYLRRASRINDLTHKGCHERGTVFSAQLDLSVNTPEGGKESSRASKTASTRCEGDEARYRIL